MFIKKSEIGLQQCLRQGKGKSEKRRNFPPSAHFLRSLPTPRFRRFDMVAANTGLESRSRELNNNSTDARLRVQSVGEKDRYRYRYATCHKVQFTLRNIDASRDHHSKTRFYIHRSIPFFSNVRMILGTAKDSKRES
jgi:hypothetical protein